MLLGAHSNAALTANISHKDAKLPSVTDKLVLINKRECRRRPWQ